MYGGQAYAEVVMVVDEEATVPKYPKHLRRLKSLLKQPQMLWGTKMGYVAEVGGGNADVMVEGLGKDVKVPKI